jgi:hypothetical protein
MVENLADIGTTGQIRYFYRRNLIPEIMTRNKESYNVESIVVTALGGSLSILCVVFPTPVHYREGGNFRAIIFVISRIS